MKKLIILILFCVLLTHFAVAEPVSISPETANGACDYIFGNSVILDEGYTNIWNNATEFSSFTSLLYAADAQIADTIIWDSNNPDFRPLTLTGSGGWSDGAITYHFVAPTGKKFDSGRIIFDGSGIWPHVDDPMGFDVRLARDYFNDGYGNVFYQPSTSNNAICYDEDSHINNVAYTIDSWVVEIPRGVTEFYYTIASRSDYKTMWGITLNAEDVILADVSGDNYVDSVAYTNYLGNSVKLYGGNAMVWNRDYTKNEFLGTSFAVLTQYNAGNIVSWDHNNPDFRPLTLTSSGGWADGALVHKFEAPEGKVFLAGTVSFSGSSIWWHPDNPMGFQVVSCGSYGNNQYGRVTAQYDWDLLEPVYDSDVQEHPADYTVYNYQVNVPNNVSEFYIDIISHWDFKSHWGQSLYVENIVLGDPVPTSCDEVLNFGFAFDGDFDTDCDVDMDDLGIFAGVWLENTDPASGNYSVIEAPKVILPASDYTPVSIDGDLADWDDQPDWAWHPMETWWLSGTVDVENARFALRWDDTNDKIYMAAMLTDSNPVNGVLQPWNDWSTYDNFHFGICGSGIDTTWDSLDYDTAQIYRFSSTGVGTGNWLRYDDMSNLIDTSVEISTLSVGTGSMTTFVEAEITPYDYYAELDLDGSATGPTAQTNLEQDKRIRLMVSYYSKDNGILFDKNHDPGIGNYAIQTTTWDSYRLVGSGYSPVIGDFGYSTGDVNLNGYTQYDDFADVAEDWLKCNDPNNTNCVENW